MDIEQMTRGPDRGGVRRAGQDHVLHQVDDRGVFPKDATRGQLVAACRADQERERHQGGENRKARLVRQTKFPAVKSVADFDFGEVSFPDGYTVDDLVSLEFVRQAQDFVFYGGWDAERPPCRSH